MKGKPKYNKGCLIPLMWYLIFIVADTAIIFFCGWPLATILLAASMGFIMYVVTTLVIGERHD